jgi:hypothetical protein
MSRKQLSMTVSAESIPSLPWSTTSFDRVMHNPILNANPAVDEAHHRVSAAGFKYYVTEMVCWATGGPQKYAGRAMGESHKDLKITDCRVILSYGGSTKLTQLTNSCG